MNPNNELDSEMLKKFAALQAVPERDHEKAHKGRSEFLRQAAEMASAVTPPEKRRHNGWMYTIQSFFKIHPKEPSPMFSTLATIFLIVSIVLGGSGATVAAAQTSQPDQPLYGLKVMSEDVRLGLTTDTQAEYQLALEFASRRAEEIQTLARAGSAPSQAVQTRYQSQVEQAIQMAANLPDDQAIPALGQVQSQLQTQEQALQQVQANGSPQAESALVQARQMLQERLKWVAEGLKDPSVLRDQLHQRDLQQKKNQMNPTAPARQVTQANSGIGNGGPQTTGTPTPGSSYGPGPGTGTGQGSNPWTTGTPTPGSSYGPGPGTDECSTCTPSGAGQNPWTTGTPTPGSGYGNGPGPDPSQTCTPGSGPQPTQSGAGSQPTQGPKSTSSGPGPQPTTGTGGRGGRP